MLRMFGQEHEVNKLLRKRVNSLSNVLTLRHELHQAFERFDIWLEEVPGKVRFILCPDLSSLSSCNNKVFNPRKIHIKW